MSAAIIASSSIGPIIDFSNYGELLPLVRNSLIAAGVLGLVGGLISIFVVGRGLEFAVHGVSETSFAGAAGALLLGGSVVQGAFVGSLIAAVLIGILGIRARDHNSLIGVLMPFGLGLGILFLSLYQGRAANKFGLLTGQIVSIDNGSLTTLVVTSLIVLAIIVALWRPLLFATVDPDVAAARGVPVRLLSVVFLLLLGLVVAVAVQIIGALLVLSVLVTPAAAALRISVSPIVAPLLAATFGLVSMLGGVLLSLGTAIPISPYVTTVSFAIYLLCLLPLNPRARRLQTVKTEPSNS
jgi:zinc/manganese transport system permease protein